MDVKSPQQIRQRYKKGVMKTQPHLRWNHEITEKTFEGGQTGLYHFYVVGDKRDRGRILDTLASELKRIAEPPNQIDQFDGTVKNSKFRFDYVAWESGSDPNQINWNHLKTTVIKDRTLYTRVKKGKDLETHIRTNLSKEIS